MQLGNGAYSTKSAYDMREARHPRRRATLCTATQRHPCSPEVKAEVKALARQALHAYRLSFVHPKTNETLSFEAPMPDDMYHLLSVLRLESGMDSALSHEQEWAEKFASEDDDDWNEDDYDVDVVYVKD